MKNFEKPLQQSLSQSILSGLGWRYTVVFSQAILRILLLAALSRLLTPKEFGLFGMASIVIGFARMLSRFGIGQAVIYEKDLTDHYIRSTHTLAIIFSVLASMFVFFLAQPITYFFGEMELQPIIKTLSLVFIIEGFTIVGIGLAEKEMRFKRLMKIDVISYALGFASVALILAIMGYGVWAIVLGTLCESVLRMSLVLGSIPFPKKPFLTQHLAKKIVLYSGGLTLSSLFNYGASQSDYLVIGRLGGADVLGFYTRAYSIMSLPATYLGQALQTVMFPALSKVRGDKVKLGDVYATASSATFFVALPAGFLISLLAEEITFSLLGGQWVGAVRPLQILAIGTAFRTCYKIDHALANATGYVYQRSFREAVYFAGILGFAYWGYLLQGVNGASVGVLIMLTVNYIFAAMLSYRILGFSYQHLWHIYSPAIMMTVFFMSFGFPVKTWLDNLAMSPFMVILIFSISIPLLFIMLVFAFPSVLGRYNKPAIKQAMLYFPYKTHRLYKFTYGRLA